VQELLMKQKTTTGLDPTNLSQTASQTSHKQNNARI